MNEAIRDYRQHLILAEQKAQEDYDKALLSLSGGGLGISIAFVEKIVGVGPPVLSALLVISWLCWALSIASVLVSYFLSRHALRCAIAQIDDGLIQLRRLGGRMATATEAANVAAGVLFVLGAILISVFAVANLEAKNVQIPKPAKPALTAPSGSHR